MTKDGYPDKGGYPVANFKNLLIGLGIVVALGVVYLVMSFFEGDFRLYPKVFYEYKSNGKTTQFNADDVRRGFNR